MINNIHKIFKVAGFVRCRKPHHEERGYALKYHKMTQMIQVFFNSFELLNDAEQILITEGFKVVLKTLSHQSKGCFLIIELNQEQEQ